MKKILKYILVSLLFVFSVTSVFAEEPEKISDIVSVSDLPQNVRDSLGRVIVGSCLYINENSYDSYHDSEINPLYLCVVGTPDVFLYITREESNYGYNHMFRLKISTNDGGDATIYRKMYSYDQIETSNNLVNLFGGVEDINNVVGYTNNGLQSNQNEYPVTNIPIFNASDTTSITNYLTEGDISGALNQNDVSPPPEIPYPTNITMSNTSKANSGKKYNNPIVVTWDSGFNSDYNYTNMRFNVSYEAVIGKQLGALKSNTTSGVIQIAQHVAYQNERQTYTIGIEKLNHDLQILLGEISDVNLKSAWLESITVYIQNEDSTNSSYKSSIKFVAYDFVTGIEDSSNPVEDDGSIGGGESDGETSGTGDGTINNPSSNGSTSNTFTGTIKQEYPKWDLYNNLNNVITGKNSIIRDYIDNDFALFGSNPLFSVLGTVMPYMPVEYFNLLKLTMSVGCGMAVVGIIFRFLRG